jgi:hypothetical protein
MYEGEGRYRPVSRLYTQRFEYRYSEHVFDKLEIVDISLSERSSAFLGRARSSRRHVVACSSSRNWYC